VMASRPLFCSASRACAYSTLAEWFL
jgi:hypothetical protein